MKKILYMLIPISLFSCGNKTNTSYPYKEDSLYHDSIALEKNNEVEEKLVFSDYYLFTNSDDKLITANHFNSNITLTFFYNHENCSLQLYDYTAKEWTVVNFIIGGSTSEVSGDYNDECITYFVEGDTNCIIQIYYNKSTNGVYAEVKNFYIEGGIHSCWMSKGEGIDVDYIERMYGKGTYYTEQSKQIDIPNTYTVPQSSSSSSFSPDDAYDEGYDEGYEQGKYDGRHGFRHGHGYDDSSDYYNYYETRYQEGYEEGYEVGYDEGQSDYKEEQEDEDY